MRPKRILNRRHKQAGAAAIEFALLFVLFFMVFYALVSYAMAMMLRESFQHAAEEGVRSAIAVDNQAFATNGGYQSAVETQARTTVGNSLAWLPTGVKTQVLGDGNANVQMSWGASNTLTVKVQYSGYTANPIMPVLTLPLVGDVPRLPADLVGQAVIQLG